VSLQRYILRRVLLMIPLVLGITLLTFAVSHLVPSDPVGANLGERAQGNPEIVRAFREKWGLDQPPPVQYARYLTGLLRGDLGISIKSTRPVMDDLKQYLPATVELALSAMLLGIVLGVPFGVLAAARRERIVDRVIRLLTLLGASAPIFWLALIALYVFYARLAWFPSPGRLDVGVQPPPPVTGLITIDAILAGQWGTLVSALWHLALPAAVLGAYQMAFIIRVTRSSVLEVISQDYVRTAQSKGLRDLFILSRHVLPNALIPTISYIGLAFGSLLSGAVITETIFAWPGIGRYAFQSAATLDFPAIMSVAIVIAAIHVLVNLTVDVLQVVVDPRIRIG
jgi:peptide/nickel transport system permease protein